MAATAHDVFVCHPSEDRATANAVVATLEADRVRCWIAPRDVLPSEEWAQAIVKAIGDSRLFVLVFSENSNRSRHVMREVEQAVGRAIPILPFRIEEVAPSPALEYYIGGTHWLDALTPPLEAHLERLVETVRVLLPQDDRPAPAGSLDVAPGEAATESLSPVDSGALTVAADLAPMADPHIVEPSGAEQAPVAADVTSPPDTQSPPVVPGPAPTSPDEASDDDVELAPDEWDVEVITPTDPQIDSVLEPEVPSQPPDGSSGAIAWKSLTPPGPASEALRDLVGPPTGGLLDYSEPRPHSTEPTAIVPIAPAGDRRRRAAALGGAAVAAIVVVAAGFLAVRQLIGSADAEVLGESITTPATVESGSDESLAPVPLPSSTTSTTAAPVTVPPATTAKVAPAVATTVPPTTAPPTTAATAPPTTAATAPPTTLAALVARNDSFTRSDRSQVCFDVVANDAGAAPLTVISVGGSEFGSASASSCGVLYSPPDLDTRVDAFVDVISYTVKDATGATASATLTVSVR